MQEIERKIDWVRINSGHTASYELRGWHGVQRNFGNGQYWYYDFSPSSKENSNLLPLVSSVPLESFNRVDWAIDYNFSNREMKTFLATCERMIGRRPTEIQASSTGKTCYWKGTKDMKIRIYQKGLKEHSDNPNWVRLEFEVRSRKLRQILEVYGYQAFDYLLGAYTKIGKKVRKIPENRTSESFKHERFNVLRSELVKKGWEKDFLIFLIESVDKEKKLLYNEFIK